MKENGMNKLIELLNEYEKLNMCRKFDSFEMNTFENSSGVDRLLEDTVISARYGFIKWLFKEDKIDTFQLAIYIEYHSDYTFVANRPLIDKNVDEDHLLMLLSIQDNPIEFLVSILK